VKNTAISMFVCLFVCLLAYLKNSASKFHQIFYTLPVAVASPRLSATQYIKYFRFCCNFHVMERIGQNQRRCICFVQFASWRH